MRGGGAAAAVLAALVARPTSVVADPLRLRGDALASVQAPAGLIVLEAGEDALPWLDAEALVWTGGGDRDHDGPTGDVLVMVVEVRDPAKRGSLRIGRHVVTAGALPPIHVDGASARARLPQRFELEAFGGLPVVPRLGPRSWDWVVGARVSRPVGAGRLGVAWMERREHGALHTHEVAVDGGGRVRGVETAAGAAWELIGRGLAEVRGSAGKRWRAVRGDLFVTHRAPSHLLPATS